MNEKSKKPNLLFIYADEMRLYSLGLWSQKGYEHCLSTRPDPVVTPNLDRLAKEGIVFTHATSLFPVCSPYRAMMLTGTYPAENGVNGNCLITRNDGLNESLVTLPEVFANNGYDTAYIGKTHWFNTTAVFDENDNYVGTEEAPGGHITNRFDTYIPPGRGRCCNRFWVQTLRDSHHDPKVYSNQPQYVNGKSDGEVYLPREFSTKFEAGVVQDYLRNEHGERPKDKPFSLMWSINPPHMPFGSIADCEEDIYNQYYRDCTVEDLLVRENVPSDHVEARKSVKIHFSLITSLDRYIGEVLHTLEEIGEADNTIVVFTSDHGEMMGSQGLMHKTVPYDESFRVPFIVRYPNMLAHRIEDVGLTPVDIMPTLLGLAHLGDEIPETVRGVNYSTGLVANDFSECPKPKAVYHSHGDPGGKAHGKGVLTNQYLYGHYSYCENLIIDYKNDPYQTKRLTPDEIPPEDLAELERLLALHPCLRVL